MPDGGVADASAPPPVVRQEPAAPSDAPPDPPASAPAAAPPVASPAPVPRDEEERGLAFTLGARAGGSLRTDMLVAGLHFGLRRVVVAPLEAEVSALFGLGEFFRAVRASAHVKLAIAFGDFRVHPLAGLSVFAYEPVGDFRDFCRHDACTGIEAGLDVGLGFGWRFLGLDLILSAFGDVLPAITLVLTTTLEL